MIDEFEIEARLRRIAEPPRPGVPAEVVEFVRELPVAYPRSSRQSRLPAWTGRRGVRLVVVPAALAFAIVVSGLVLGIRTSPQDLGSDGKPQWTGLEWRDVSGQVPLGWPVRWSQGYAMLTPDGTLRLSSDGLTWSSVGGAPQLASVQAMPGGLIGFGGVTAPCPELPQPQTCTFEGGHPWLSTDGVHWREATDLPAATAPSPADPFDTYFQFSFVSDPTRALYATKNEVCVTADGASWVHTRLPADMAAAVQRTIRIRWPSGYVAEGLVPQAGGPSSMSRTDGAGNTVTVTGEETFWESSDGLTWSRAAASSHQDLATTYWFGSRGAVRYASGHLDHSTDGGLTWVEDKVLATLGINEYSAFSQLASDDDRIVAASWQGAAPTFWVSYGDGRWQRLAIGGDLSQAREVPMLVTPGGILLFGGERRYFGEAVSGGAPQGTFLTPRPTATPGPSQTPHATTTPAATATPAGSGG